VVGIVGFDTFNPSDIATYASLQLQAPGQPPLKPPDVTIVATEGGNPTKDSDKEATTDVELVYAMAPGAKILFFQGSTGITGHLDDILQAMADSNPQLTVASCSLSFKPSDNSEQALVKMAGIGVSFLTASGDYGDIGDPQDNTRMENQTLVGGTFLGTNTLIAPLPKPDYPDPYYAGETTWNEGRPPQSKDVTGGGIMDGNNRNGQCDIFCGDPVPIPDYQVGVDMAINGGSTKFRNYPDVATIADNIEIVFNGSTTLFNGTSAAAPLWAGFIALANQRAAKNNAGTAGFLNPTLYDIGKTSGQSVDLYKACFNDIADGGNNANGYGPGFKTVPGYDLCTGWIRPSPRSSTSSPR
jgi:xanthomonalisin